MEDFTKFEQRAAYFDGDPVIAQKKGGEHPRAWQPGALHGGISRIIGLPAAADGPIKTFPWRGIKDSPTYLHDGRLPTLEDTVEFFNLILGVNLTKQEKLDLVVFMRAL